MAKEKEQETEVISEQETQPSPKKWKEMTTNEKWRQVGKFSFQSFIWLFVLMFIIDIVTKTLIRDHLYEGQVITLINNFLYVTFEVNDGMAWGIATNNQTVNMVIFVSISLIASVVIILVMALRYKRIPKFARACCMIILAGCIGNLVDRAFYSAEFLDATTRGVVDWISFKFGNYWFPTFNWADSCLVVGIIMLIVWLIVWDTKETRKEKAEKDASSQSAEAIKQSQMEAIMHGESVTTPESETTSSEEGSKPLSEESKEDPPRDETGNKD